MRARSAAKSATRIDGSHVTTDGRSDKPILTERAQSGNRRLQLGLSTSGDAGSGWQGHGLVFASSVGTPLDAHNVRREFKVIARQAGLEEAWTPRELRHSFVSLLSEDGMAIEKISHLVGHVSSTITETVYRRELRPVITHGAEAMDKLFANK